MTATSEEDSYLPSWSRSSKLRQERIFKRLAENGTRAIKVDLEAIHARRERLKHITKSMKRPLEERATSSSPSSAVRTNIRLQPIGPRPPNQLDKKRQDDFLLQKRRVSFCSPSPISSAKERRLKVYEERGSENEEMSQSEDETNQESEENEKEETEKEEEKEEDEDGEDNSQKSQSTDNEQEMHLDNEISEEIKSIGDELESDDEASRLKGVERARKHLTEEFNPLFESYYEEGIIPPLIACLSSPSSALQLKAASVITYIVSEKSKYANAVYEAEGIPLLIKLLSSSDVSVVIECAAALGSLAEKSIFICGKIIELGAVAPLHNVAQNTDSIDSLRTLSKTTRTITSHKSLSPPQEDIEALVSDAKKFLLCEDEEIYLNGCWSFADLTESDRHKIDVVLAADVVPHIIESFLDSEDNSRVTPAVKAIGNILAESDEQTDSVVEAGVIPVLVKQLSHSSLRIRKDCAWALSNIMGGTRSQIQKAIDANALPILQKSIEEDDDPARKESIWCISNLTEIGSPSQIQEAIKVNLLPSLASNIKRYTLDYDKSLLYHILNAIRNMIKYCDDELAVNEILEKVDLEDIVKLTVWDDNDISELAKLLYFYLSYDEEEEEEIEEDEEEEEKEGKNEVENEVENIKKEEEKEGFKCVKKEDNINNCSKKEDSSEKDEDANEEEKDEEKVSHINEEKEKS